MTRLGIPHWGIVCTYEPIPSADDDWQHRADCQIAVNYNKALIRFNPEAFDDEADLVKTIRHELFHIVLSPYDVFLAVVRPLLEPTEVVGEMARAAWTHAIEQGVVNLERMYLGLTDPPADLAGKGHAKPKGRARG
jgi:hypothetical protein